MNIALAHDHLFQIGGAERVLLALQQTFPTADIVTLIRNRVATDFFNPTQIRTSYLQHMPGGVSFFKWYLPAMPGAWERLDFLPYDLVISSASAFAKGVRVREGAKHICYCHSPTRYLWSDTVEYVQSLHLPASARSVVLQQLNGLREWDYAAAQRVDFFIANSRHIAERIQKYYHRSSTVIYPPVDVASFHISESRDDYYLVVSRLRPYKKVDMVVEAFNNLKLPLVVIGGGEELFRLKKKAKKNITFLGEVPDSVRNRYLSRCTALIYPQVEDFGISAVEAMASGRPVIAYRAGGALETIKEGVTGVFFDEQTWEALAYAVLTFDQRQYDADAIRAHAEQFDATRFRERILSFIAEHV